MNPRLLLHTLFAFPLHTLLAAARDYVFKPTAWSHEYPIHYGDDYEDSNFEIGALNRELELQAMKTHGIAPREVNPDYKAEGTRNIELKYTNLSKETTASGYVKKLQYSKIFKFTATHDNLVNMILVSTTKRYHPQVVVSEVNNDTYTELTKSKLVFNCSRGKSYILEVGHNKEVNTDPFEDISSGGYTLLLSSTSETLKDTMLQESIKVSIWGYSGFVPFGEDAPLKLHHQTRRSVNHGHLNYSITPFYNEDRESITLYFHLGVDSFSGAKKRSATLEIVCDKNTRSTKTFYGKEPSTAKYEYKVESSRICGVIDLIK